MKGNRRRSRIASHADGGSAWISYSDMMAALLLLFVLVLCYSMYQSLSSLESKTVQLVEQAALLSTQQESLNQAQSQLQVRENELDEANVKLSNQQALLDSQQLALDAKQADLDTSTLALTQNEEELEAANLALAQRQTELTAAQEQVEEQQMMMAAQQKKLNDLVGVRTKIVRDLTTNLTTNNINATVDPNTGDIMLESAVFFEYGKNTLTESGKLFLQRFIPVYLNVLLSKENKDYLGEIIIEGHTDSVGSYLSNLKLSQERALSVASYCLEMPELTSSQRTMLQKILTVTGKSYSSLIYNEDGSENAEASRRVEFKFRLKDTEMIDEIRNILSSQSEQEAAQ